MSEGTFDGRMKQTRSTYKVGHDAMDITEEYGGKIPYPEICKKLHRRGHSWPGMKLNKVIKRESYPLVYEEGYVLIRRKE